MEQSLDGFYFSVASGQQLTCLGSSLERHLGNLEEKGVGGLGGTRERQNQDKALFKVQFYYSETLGYEEGEGKRPIPAKSSLESSFR